MSPFFEFYIDDLMPFFEKRFDYILDFNLKCFEVLLESLQLNLITSKTLLFQKDPKDKNDFRKLVNRNYELDLFQPYTQVFTEKHGFISNLSILDVLFNEGPNVELYLRNQNL